MAATPAHHVDLAEPDVSVPVPQDATTSTASHLTEPPPEKPSDIRRRTLVIFSFWLIVLCLGLPIWWRTTAIPRANLPLDEMMDWADGKVCCPVSCSSLPLLQHQAMCADGCFSRPVAQSSPSASRSRQTSSRPKRPTTSCA